LSFDDESSKEDESRFYSRTKKEIDTWRPYVEALRMNDRQTLRDMLNSASSYSDAINHAERGYDTESLLMSIILNQQKTIDWLSSKMRGLKEELDTKRDN
jgi:hypothetical protein